jgi:hypothetical protein
VGATEIRQRCDHHTRVGYRLLKRCEMNPGIADRVMRQGRQRLAVGLRDILSRDSATWFWQHRPTFRVIEQADHHPALEKDDVAGP